MRWQEERHCHAPLEGGGGSSSSSSVSNTVQSASDVIGHFTSKTSPLVLFGKTWCEHCQRALAALREKGVHPFVVWMDRRSDESDIQMLLSRHIGNIQKRTKGVTEGEAEGEGEEGVTEGVTEGEEAAVVAWGEIGSPAPETNATTVATVVTAVTAGEDESGDSLNNDAVLTVPQVFLFGELLGGADATIALLKTEEANVLVGMSEKWHATNGVEVCWEWVEALHANAELLLGVDYYKFMGEKEGGVKIFKPPKRNDTNRHQRPPICWE